MGKQIILMLGFLVLLGCQANIPEVQEDIDLNSEVEVDDVEVRKIDSDAITTMSEEVARAVAEKSSCLDEGVLTDEVMYNDYTKTWWFDMEVEGSEGCSPACVVSQDKSAEINWRCTGLKQE